MGMPIQLGKLRLHDGGVVHHGAGRIVVAGSHHVTEGDDHIGLGNLLKHDFAVAVYDPGRDVAALRNAVRLGLHHVFAGFDGGLCQKGRAENKPPGRRFRHHLKVRHVIASLAAMDRRRAL